MNFSKLREKAAFIRASKFLLAILGLAVLLEHGRYLVFISSHIGSNQYDLKLILSPQPDFTVQLEDRLSQIKEMKLNPAIPVGFIGDSKVKAKDEYVRDYYLARYALVPLMVKINEEHDTTVCDFPLTLSIHHPMNPLAGDDRWTVISDNGKGALLLIKKKKL